MNTVKLRIIALGFAPVVGLATIVTACGGDGGEQLDETEWAARVCAVWQRLAGEVEQGDDGSAPAPQSVAEAHRRAAEDLAGMSPPPSARAYHEALQKRQEVLAEAASATAGMVGMSDSPSEEVIEGMLDALNRLSKRADAVAAWDLIPDSAKAALNRCTGE